MSTSWVVEFYWDDSWVDETSYVRRVQVKAGFEKPGDSVASVGRASITLNNASKRFSPGYADGALYGDLLPRKEVRVKATDGVDTWTLFRGYVETFVLDPGAGGGRQVVIECVDGMALLAGHNLSVVHEDSKDVDAAVSAVVAAAYTPPATSYSDNGDSLNHYGRDWEPETTTARDALGQLCVSTFGRFWVARDATATFWTRQDRLDCSAAAVLEIGEEEEEEEPTYSDEVKDTDNTNLRRYYRLNEASGGNVDDYSDHDVDATATGVTWGATGIGDGETSGSFDGINDFVNIYNADLNTNFSRDKGTIMVWVTLDSVAADGVVHNLFKIGKAWNEMIAAYRWSSSLTFQFRDSGNTASVYKSSLVADTWYCFAMTWDTGADAFKLYFNGVQTGATQTGLSAWGAGNLATNECTVGASATTPSNCLAADIAHFAIWDVVLGDAAILALASV